MADIYKAIKASLYLNLHNQHIIPSWLKILGEFSSSRGLFGDITW